jgi:uncharacterized protein YndB with AHSA1/START domain
MTFMVKHISVSINRSADQVYEFVSDPENLPKWAAELSGSIKKVNDDWIAESPMGRVKVKFAEKNRFGVLDHDVTLPSGVKVYNPCGSSQTTTAVNWFLRSTAGRTCQIKILRKMPRR